MSQPIVQHFFDEPTNTFSYVVRDPDSQACAIIDSVLDFDYAAGRTDVRSADEIIEYVKDQGLTVEWILETHVHADHLSAAPYLHDKLGGKTGIGANITVVQDVFGKAFNAGTEFARDGSQFDRLFEEGDTFAIGHLEGRVLHTPGHTRPSRWPMAIPCSCRILAPPAVIFPAGMPAPCISPSRKYWRFRRKPVCSCVTTTAHRSVMNSCI